MLGKLANLGYGPDKVVPIAFHVDYFNTPWKDPFSDPDHSKREMAYNTVLHRDDLYFTPMMMIDGREPMLGSDQPKAQAALRRLSAEKPGATIELGWKDEPGSSAKKTLSVEVLALSPAAVDRDALIGVAIFEDPVTTAVASGENGGKTLVEHYAVRKFSWKKTQLASSGAKSLSFPLELGADWKPERCGVAVFVQDWSTGRVHQAESIPWNDKLEQAREK